jgi:hypothetical protein
MIFSANYDPNCYDPCFNYRLDTLPPTQPYFTTAIFNPFVLPKPQKDFYDIYAAYPCSFENNLVSAHLYRRSAKFDRFLKIARITKDDTHRCVSLHFESYKDGEVKIDEKREKNHLRQMCDRWLPEGERDMYTVVDNLLRRYMETSWSFRKDGTDTLHVYRTDLDKEKKETGRITVDERRCKTDFDAGEEGVFCLYLQYRRDGVPMNNENFRAACRDIIRHY